MLKIRTILLPVGLALFLMPIFWFMTAKTEVISNPSNDPASVISRKGGSGNQFEVTGPSYPAKFVDCADIGVFASVVACANPSLIPAHFEVPAGPTYPAKFVECVAMGVVGSVVACPNPSQIPAP